MLAGPLLGRVEEELADPAGAVRGMDREVLHPRSLAEPDGFNVQKNGGDNGPPVVGDEHGR